MSAIGDGAGCGRTALPRVGAALVARRAAAAGALSLLGALPLGAAADTVLTDADGIIRSSLCVGTDCSENGTFGNDTLLLRDTSPWIHFDDTSFSSFPSNDWRLIINDVTEGGMSHFSIEDVTGGEVPFRIDAGAVDNAVRVGRFGFVGLGTATPAVNLHIADDFSPRVRFDTTTGTFFRQIWEVIGDDFGFRVIDVNSGKESFYIEPGVPSGSLVVRSNSGVGLGTLEPDADALHVQRTFPEGLEPALVLENDPSSPAVAGNVKWEIKVNGATGRMTFKNLLGTTGPGGGPTTPFKFAPEAVENLLRVGAGATDLVDIAGNLEVRRKSGSTTEGGNLTVRGDLIVDGNCSEQDGACADYVFEDGYELRSLDEVAAFIDEYGHLPNVPSAAEMAANGVNMTHLSGRLLEKIEELMLYTLAQHERDARHRELTAGLQDVVARQRDLIGQLDERLRTLEAD